MIYSSYTLSGSEHLSEVGTASLVLSNVKEAGSFFFALEDTEERNANQLSEKQGERY